MTKEYKGWSLGGITFGLRQTGRTPESSILNRLEPKERLDALASMREAKSKISVTTQSGDVVVLERATAQY